MKDYKLSNKEIAELERMHRSLRDKRQADRVKAVIALSKGWPAAQIAEILLFDEKTSRQYFDRYRQGGIEALLDDNYSGAEPKLGVISASRKNLKFLKYFDSGDLAEGFELIDV